ncbi:MAG: pyridoxal phosphate-dependent aminotransferase [Proteobacteria bacterium]|nr:pyridoxal phosphate-dependent aminotransferase [Pseudomonadota bacterium]
MVECCRRAKDIPPFIVMDVLERAQELERQGVDVIHLEVGEPDFDTPECVLEAAKKAVADNRTHYTHSQGLLPLREAIADYHLRTYGTTFSPEQVVVTAGTSPGLLILFAALIEAGDEVIMSNPGYACYPNVVRFVGGTPVLVDVFEEDGWQLRPEDIAGCITDRTRAILINSPANPTGHLLSAERMAKVAGLGPMVVSDEIYHGLVYEGRENSIFEFFEGPTDRAAVLGGFSKLYAMTGWRLGYLVVPPGLVRALQKMSQNFFICAPSISQWAGLAALTCADEDVARMRSIYDERRRFMVQRLRDLGFGLMSPPTGAFYVLAGARHLAESSFDLAFDILERAHVGVSPGIDFGPGAEGYLRFTYANSIENIARAMDRLEEYLAQNFPGQRATG